MRRWKLALSLAVVAAITVPSVAGTWRLAPGRWVDLTESQKKRIENHLEFTNHCTFFPGAGEDDDPIKRKVIDELVCRSMQEQLANAGVWYPPESVTQKYLTTNFIVAVGAFVLTFVTVMVGPSVGRRYLAWLRR